MGSILNREKYDFYSFKNGFEWNGEIKNNQTYVMKLWVSEKWEYNINMKDKREN